MKRIKDSQVDINDPYFNPEAADPVETLASVIEAVCPDIAITEVEPDGVYLPRPLTPEEGNYISESLGITIPIACYNKPSFLPVSDSVHVKDEFNEGDVYNDGTYQGVIKSVNSDSITVESQNEDGDVVDIEIPISDSAEMDEFLMKILLGKKVKCPKTKNEYKIEGKDFLINGKKQFRLPSDVVSAVTQIKSAIKKAKPIKDDIHSFTDKNLEELLVDGTTQVHLDPYETAEDVASLMESEICKYQAPNEEPILLRGEDNGDSTATVTVII